MSHYVGTFDAWDDGSGAAESLTDTYVDGSVIQQPRPANTIRLEATLAWSAAPTSVQVQILYRTGTAWIPLSAVNSVSGGTIDLDDGTWEPTVAAAGSHEVFASIPPAADVKVRAKMVDAGASDPTLLVRATLTDE